MTRKVMALVGLAVLSCAAALRAQQPADAASLYTRNCASCHGAKGTPAGSMAQSMRIPDFAAAATLASQSDSALKSVVSGGKGRMMPAYKTRLTAEQIASLVTYIRTFSKH